jgi:hypothetical protein
MQKEIAKLALGVDRKSVSNRKIACESCTALGSNFQIGCNCTRTFNSKQRNEWNARTFHETVTASVSDTPTLMSGLPSREEILCRFDFEEGFMKLRNKPASDEISNILKIEENTTNTDVVSSEMNEFSRVAATTIESKTYDKKRK